MRTIWIAAILALTATAAQALQFGTQAPAFSLPDQHSTTHALEDYQGDFVVLYFYPRADTPGCTVEAQNFSKAIDWFTERNTQVFGISTDSVEDQKAFSDKYQLPFSLLADDDGEVTKAYGVMGGIPLMRMAKRQTFIIDPNGVVVKHFPDVDPNTHVAQVQEALIEARALYQETVSPDYS